MSTTRGAAKSKEGNEDEPSVSQDFMRELMTGLQAAITTALAAQQPGITATDMNTIIASLRPPAGTTTLPTTATAPTHPPTFAATPGKANPSTFIDYETTYGLRQWSNATSKLPTEYDVDSEGAVTFCEELRQKSQEMGWDTGTTDILTIPVTKDGSTKQLNLLSQYGLIDEEDIRAQCLTYCHTATRQAQNNYQLAACILNSLSVDGRKTIASEPSKYHTDDTLATQSGPMLFKLIMSKALVDNKSTTSMYRGNLQNLEIHMGVLNSNIVEFNQYVTDNRKQLANRNESIGEKDMIKRLFRAYLAAQDSHFVDFINVLKVTHRSSSSTLTAVKLQDQAYDFYVDAVRTGEWGAQTPDQKRIVALAAQITEIKGGLKLSRQLVDKLAQGQNKRTPKVDAAKPTTPTAPGKGTGKATQRKYDEWKLQAPKDGEPKVKEVNGKSFNWCPRHQLWTVHTPAECNLLKQQSFTNTTGQSTSNPQRDTTALMAVEDDESVSELILALDQMIDMDGL